jgi:uncharacterized lipoprotein YajG
MKRNIQNNRIIVDRVVFYMGIFCLYIAIFFLFSCATNPKIIETSSELIPQLSQEVLPPSPPPEWAATLNAVTRVYPNDRYIAQRGRGTSRETAEVDAATQISRYIESQVNANIGYRLSTSSANGVITESLDTLNESFIKSQTSLFALRYAPDPWNNTAEKEWQTVAYIDRDEAWEIYKPRLQRQADAFSALYHAADDEADAFKKALRWRSVEQYLRSDAFKTLDDSFTFGQILHPEKMNDGFSYVQSEIAAVTQKTDDARRNAAVFINCPGDFESLVGGALSRSLTAEGFPIAKESKGAAAVCAVTVTEGMQKQELGIFYHPSLQAVFSSSAGTLWTFNTSADRVGAVTPEVAKRRAYTALAEQAEKTFSAKFNSETGHF